MAQLILDPADTTTTDTITVPTLPPDARQFGFLPNVRNCQPGDVVLYASLKPNTVGRNIAVFQRNAGFAEEHARWTHAAVFLFDDVIVEAIPGSGVVTRTIYEDVPHKLIRVRRHPGLTEAERFRIALRAMRMLGSSYSHGFIARLAWQMRNRYWNRHAVDERGIVICSQVFLDAYMDERRLSLQGCPIGSPATPAHLSATADLQDQRVGWSEIT